MRRLNCPESLRVHGRRKIRKLGYDNGPDVHRYFTAVGLLNLCRRWFHADHAHGQLFGKKIVKNAIS